MDRPTPTQRQLVLLRHAKAAWPDGTPAAVLDERIYAAEPDELLAVLHDLPEAATTALLIGHNPGVEELVELLSGQDEGMSTASLAVLTWEGRWKDADAQVAQLRAHATPRA